MEATSVLDQEMGCYEKRHAELFEHHAGKFVLIKGDELIGAFDTQEAAYAAGVERFGNQPMLIRRVTQEDPVERSMAPSAMTVGGRGRWVWRERAMREPGCYWVRREGHPPEVGHYDQAFVGHWELTGTESSYSDDELEVLSGRLMPPEEKP